MAGFKWLRRRLTRSKPLRWLTALVLVLVILVVVVAIWVIHLDREVTLEFQGRHWSVPARVYAAPLDLYVGAAVSAAELEEELRRLHYRVGDPATGPGVYRRRANSFDLHARRVRFSDELREAQVVSISADSNSITAMKQADGSDLPVFRLDPPVIGSVSPVQGEDRLILAPGDVPPLLRSGIKLIEDRRFDEHHGVDPLGILRALWANLRARRVVQGGSTPHATAGQELLPHRRAKCRPQIQGGRDGHAARSAFLQGRNPLGLPERGISRTGRPARHPRFRGLAASIISRSRSMNSTPPNSPCSSVSSRDLPTTTRAAIPTARSLRRNLVLEELGTAHLIDPAAAKQAMAAPLGLRPPGGTYVPAYLDLVRRHLKRDYAEADLAAAGLSVYTSLDTRAQAAAERALTANLKRLDGVSRQRGDHLQGAVVVAEPNSGDVVAVVGGRDVGTDGLNRALDAHRPIGSLVKPAVYLAAVESGRYNAATVIEDSALELKLSDGSVWAPQNFEHEFYGQVPMARALAKSMNLATVRLGLDLGLPKVAETLQRLGLETAPALNPSMLLGTVEMTPLEVLHVYTSLANGGFRARLRAVRAVVDEQGRPLKSFKVQVEEAAPAAAVYQVDRMLTLVTSRGTGQEAAARLPRNIVVAGKTGTSSDTRDSWFAGFTGSYVAVAWVGYDDNRETGLTGAMGGLPVWADTLSKLKSESFAPVPPESVEDVWIDFGDGLQTTQACSADAVSVAIPKDTVLPVKPGCAGVSSGAAAPLGTSPNPTMGDKIKSWFKNIVH